MKHKRHAVGRLLRTKVDVEGDVEVVSQVDLVVEDDTSCLVFGIRRERVRCGWRPDSSLIR